MKIHLLCLLLALFTGSRLSFSQTSAGTFMYGGLVSASFSQSEGQNVLMAEASPNLLVFVKDNVAAGGSVDVGIVRYGESRYSSLGMFPTARYYFGRVQQPAKFFLLGDAGYHLISYSKIINNTAKTGLGLGGGPGFTYFFSSNVALEALARTRFLRYSDTSTALQYQLKIGVQLSLKPGRR